MRDETLRALGRFWNLLLAASSALLVAGIVDDSCGSREIGAAGLGFFAGCNLRELWISKKKI